jgi:hypothetical protein
MGMDLLGRDGHDERVSAEGWRECLECAVQFGWKPAGTVAPTDYCGEWNGNYWSNDWQMVTDRDARALGEALLRAATALSAHEREWPELLKAKQKYDPFAEDELTETKEPQFLRRLANFALNGVFVIR